KSRLFDYQKGESATHPIFGRAALVQDRSCSARPWPPVFLTPRDHPGRQQRGWRSPGGDTPMSARRIAMRPEPQRPPLPPGPFSADSPGLPEAVRLLVEARDYARQSEQDVWDWAIELPWLLKAGLSVNALRWLLAQGHVAQAMETTRARAG